LRHELEIAHAVLCSQHLKKCDDCGARLAQTESRQMRVKEEAARLKEQIEVLEPKVKHQKRCLRQQRYANKKAAVAAAAAGGVGAANSLEEEEAALETVCAQLRQVLAQYAEVTAPVKPADPVPCNQCQYGRLRTAIGSMLQPLTTIEAYDRMRQFHATACPSLFDRSHGCACCGTAMSREAAFKNNLPWLPGAANPKLDVVLRQALQHSRVCEYCVSGPSADCPFKSMSPAFLASGRWGVLSPLVHPTSPYKREPGRRRKVSGGSCVQVACNL
jgi:hypothetical protein